MIEQDKTQQLIELAKLRESGVVTESEFLSLKKEIIHRKTPSGKEDTVDTQSGNDKQSSLETHQIQGSGQSKTDDVVQGCIKYLVVGAIVLGVFVGIYVYFENAAQSELSESAIVTSNESNPSNVDSKEWQELLDLLSYQGFDKGHSSPIFIDGREYDGMTKAGLVFNGKTKSFNKQYSYFTSYDSWLLFRDNPVSWQTETGKISDLSIHFSASNLRTDGTPIVHASWKSDDNTGVAEMEIFPITLGENAQKAIYYGLYTQNWSVWSYRELHSGEWMKITSAFEKVLGRKLNLPLTDKIDSITKFSLKEDVKSVRDTASDACIDPAGREYSTIQIGDQIWMAENLAYRPNRGQYWAYNDDRTQVKTYGYLYDWETAISICPDGWRLPNDEDWDILTDHLGGNNVAGLKMKSTVGWNQSGNGTNESGFSALPGGYRYPGGYCNEIGVIGYWWSSSEDKISKSFANARILKYDFNTHPRSPKNAAYSVRCIMD